MAQIHEEIIVIKLSKLIKENVTVESLTDSDMLGSIEAVVQELYGSGVVVEIEQIKD